MCRLTGKVPLDFGELYPRLYPVIAICARGKLLDWWIYKHYKGAFGASSGGYSSNPNRYKQGGHPGMVVAKIYYPDQPRTGKQQGWKSVFYDAVQYWRGFDDGTKNYYNQRAKPIGEYGYHRFLSYYLKANFPMIIYWEPLKQSASQNVTVPDYMASDYFKGISRIFPDTTYPANPPYGAIRYRSDLKKYLGFKENAGWSDLGGAAQNVIESQVFS